MQKEIQGEYKGSHGAVPFLGRLLIALIFIVSGSLKIVHFEQASHLLQKAGIEGADAFTAIALAMELLGGSLIVLGLFTRIAIYILMIFLLPTTLIFHSFWQQEGPEMMVQLANFLKNVAIYGGLVLLLNYGPGKWSLDACFSKN